MGTKTSIEWTDSTWSPIRFRVKADAAAIAETKGYTSLVSIAEKMAGHVGSHCEHVSPGCLHCYAGANNHRCLPANGTGLPYDRRSRDLVDPFVDEKTLLQPLKWGTVKEQVAEQIPGFETNRVYHRERPRRIFVENQSDLFGEWVTDEMLDRVFAVMALCPQHTFQVLTKRPERMLAYSSDERLFLRVHEVVKAILGYDNPMRPAITARNLPLPNVWLGTSVENQAAADERVPLLLQTPAAVRFISAEPLLGPVRLDRAHEEECAGDFEDCAECGNSSMYVDFFTAHAFCAGDKCTAPGEALAQGRIDWVICGGESGPGARPMHPEWARSLRDQCAAAGVSFFFKQWGEWLPLMQHPPTGTNPAYSKFCMVHQNGVVSHGRAHEMPPAEAKGIGYGMARVGKKAAGALLDRVEHKAFPETSHA